VVVNVKNAIVMNLANVDVVVKIANVAKAAIAKNAVVKTVNAK
jgi:multisubunit Na+/H+ antiporter MnhB subunit